MKANSSVDSPLTFSITTARSTPPVSCASPGNSKHRSAFVGSNRITGLARFAGKAAVACCGLASAACLGLADLRPEAMKRGSGDPAAAERSIQGAKLFDQMTEAAGLDAYRRKIDSGDVLRLVIVDDWQSTLIRSFTPLPENITRLQLEISPGPIPDIAATVLAPNPESGTDKSGAQPQDPPAIRFGIRDGSAYYANAEEEREGPDAADVKVYLESLWLYLSLAQQLGSAPGARASASALPDAQAPGAPGKTMQRIFISPGGAAPASDRDQYILWMPPEDARVAFVEFTYREVFDFYQGALYYKDMRRVAGLLLPFTTRVTDGIDDPESVHTIQIESAEFARPR